MKRIFVCAEHQEYGGLGWKPLNRPMFDPLQGMGVAHDILEHRPRSTDSLADEIQAFGAMQHIRGSEYLRDKGRHIKSQAENSSYEIVDLLIKAHMGFIPGLADIKDVPSCPDIFNELVVLDIAVWNQLQQVLSEEGEEVEPLQIWTEETRSRLHKWYRRGYLGAKRRYRGIDRHELLNAFQGIEAKADSLLKRAYEGQCMAVSLVRDLGYLVYEVELLDEM